MIEEIQEAVSLIKERPQEAAIIHFALSLPESYRSSFMLAWNLVKGDVGKEF